MGKNLKKNPTPELKVDPTDELLETLIKDINLDESDLKSISEMNAEYAGSANENAETEIAKREVPDGLELTATVHTQALVMPGLKAAVEDDESMAHLLNNNFADENSKIETTNHLKAPKTPDQSDRELEFSSVQFNKLQKFQEGLQSTSEENSSEAIEIIDDGVMQVQDLEPSENLENFQDPEVLNQLNGKSEESAVAKPQPIPTAPGEFDSVSKVFSDYEKPVNEKTVALSSDNQSVFNTHLSISDKTVAVAGFSDRYDQNFDEKVKVSIGQIRTSPLSSWNKADSNLGIAHNMELAQDKIVSLEKENEALRQQNEELVAAAEIIKERADMLASEMNFLKNDRDSLDQSFKNELLILRNQLNRKDSEIQKASSKTEELESRLKFDMKKIRVRERELENRLELLRAEKNALVKSKDEMILDLRRKCDQFQLETESFRQKCIELNKVIESSQESVKRTTRALRLAMANLELQDEGKQLIKKAE
jgi:hypothetical protein